MERIPTTQLAAHAGEQIRLAGWLHRFRQFGSIGFLIVRDGFGLAQVVVDNPTLIAQLAALPSESVLEIEGEAVAAEQAPGGIEVRASRVAVIAEASAPPPFDLFRPALPAQRPTILDHASVALRHPRHRAMFRLQATSVKGFRATLDSLGFVEVHTPKIVASATESGANVFTIDYFGRPAYLAQSPQFYKQIMVGVFERVYEVGPVFRAEPHDTPRHLNEYVSLDVEMGFITDHRTVMGVLTDVIRGMLQALEAETRTIALLDVRLPAVPERIPEIHFSDALALISDDTGEDVRAEIDLAPVHERWLGEWAEREYHSDFLFVTGYPMRKRPFYTHPDPASPEYSNSFDLIFRGLELVTGGQRLHRYADYLSALEARGQDSAPLGGYLEAFKYGMPPHGGFALGLERWVAQLTGASNVRETTLFPRDLNRITP
ncbi:MAG TPA: aspartate--tRNA(Asn) ligase [Dehalococcoidia bacterium]|nr:aspartate--tRNA(Asn) ligase [Dehalococcoidia bacterium]